LLLEQLPNDGLVHGFEYHVKDRSTFRFGPAKGAIRWP
jgi:hypothetical protein